MRGASFTGSTRPDSTLSRNFLVIAPNIIVLDRLRADFDGLRIFFNDPVLPANGHDGRNWRDDFQITLHIQDDVRAVRETGNIFLTNIHRVFLGDVSDPSLEDDDLRDYFLDPFGPKPVGKTTDSKTDLGEIVREVDELAVFNDEAHHIHDPRMAWFKSHPGHPSPDAPEGPPAGAAGGRDRHAASRQRRDLRADGLRLSARRSHPSERRQAPRAARRGEPREAARGTRARSSPRSTPTTCSSASRNGARATPSTSRSGKKAVLFVMVDDTRNCDDVGAYLEKICPELQGAVLVIHTKNNGEISEAASGKSKEELELLRKQSNEIDSWTVALQGHRLGPRCSRKAGTSATSPPSSACAPTRRRATSCPSRRSGAVCAACISARDMPGDRVGDGHAGVHGLRRVHSERRRHVRARADGRRRAGGQDSLVVEVDTENPDKDLDALDIALPRLTRRFHREFKDLDALDPAALGNAQAAAQAVHAGGNARDRLQD